MKQKQELFIVTLIKRLVKRVRFSTLLLLAVLFASNSFAWFVYSTRVQNTISAQIKAWSVAFEIGSSSAVSYVTIDVADIYPGMTTFNRSIRASNNGDTPATLSYEVLSVTLFGTTYTTNQTLTSEQLAYSFSHDYPFKINVTLSTGIIGVGNHNESYNISVSWPYDSGDDEEDTYWGNLAYDYHTLHPDDPSISMEIKVLATQLNPDD